MNTQNQIKRTLSDRTAIERIRELLDSTKDLHRTELADRVCEEFGFIDARGIQATKRVPESAE